VVPEINMGQMILEVERCAAGQAQVLGVNIPGGDVLEPHKVLNAIRRAAGREVREEAHVRKVTGGSAEE